MLGRGSESLSFHATEFAEEAFQVFDGCLSITSIHADAAIHRRRHVQAEDAFA
jgi:hypothetical protein